MMTETPPPDPGQRWGRRVIVVLVVLVCLVLATGVAAIGLAVWGKARVAAPGPSETATTFVVRRGTGLNEIARALESARIIDNVLIFRLAVQFMGEGKPLKAGEYRFAARATIRAVMDKMIRGEVVLHRVTLAEGLTTVEIFAVVGAAGGLEGAVTLKPEEGRFLPETYYFPRGETRDALLGRMRAAMDKALDELWAKRAPDLPIKTKREALVLASIIEKETSVASERRLIAGVFVNRLRRGMRLQTDPTVIYGITMGKAPLGRPLFRSELDRPTPYNTYQIDGLPPGPIANPGRDSIAAALDPAKTDYLYFVADGSGGHAFARTGREHERNVAKWRRVQQKQKRK